MSSFLKKKQSDPLQACTNLRNMSWGYTKSQFPPVSKNKETYLK